MAPPPPPPPPRSSKPAPPKPAPTTSSSSPVGPSTPPSPSRPGTPSSAAGARAPKAQTLALPALLRDLSTLLSHPAPLLPADKFAPAPPLEAAYAPRKPEQDRQKRARELLAGVRAGTTGPDEQLACEDAPLLADVWVAAMDRVLSRAEAHDAQRAGEGVVDRADKIERWAGEVERGLAHAA
ncbi:hypothetical protein JCM8208_004598 [Rhodotorula glutinis]